MGQRSTIDKTIQLMEKNGYLIGRRFVFFNDETKRKPSLEKFIALAGMEVLPCTMADPKVIEEERREIERRKAEEAKRKRDEQLKTLATRLMNASKTKVIGKLLRTSPLTEYEQAWMDYVRVLWG